MSTTTSNGEWYFAEGDEPIWLGALSDGGLVGLRRLEPGLWGVYFRNKPEWYVDPEQVAYLMSRCPDEALLALCDTSERHLDAYGTGIRLTGCRLVGQPEGAA